MDVLNFGCKLIKHGGIFLLRVGGIVLPAVAGLAVGGPPQLEVSDRDKSEWDHHMDAMHDNTNLYYDAR